MNTLSFQSRLGNHVDLLINGDQIFAAMLEAIREARTEVLLETYIYWDGSIGEQFAEALASASRRGVCVRVVLDAYGSTELGSDLIDIMVSGGVELRRHRPVQWMNLRKSNYRSHRKLMIVDGSIGFIGGVGIADEWRGKARNPDEWRDNHYRIRGPVVNDMHSLFFTHWDSSNKIDPHLLGEGIVPHSPGSSECRLLASDPLHGDYSFEKTYVRLLNGAKERIRIISPYFVLSDRFLKLVEAAARRGVKIEIISAGQHNDKRVTRLASRHDWGDLLEVGVKIFEYNKTLIHAKLFLVDDDQLLVGSANFDVRSMTLNEEASLHIRDSDLASKHHRLFEEDLANSREISLKNWRTRPITIKAFDFASHLLRPML